MRKITHLMVADCARIGQAAAAAYMDEAVALGLDTNEVLANAGGIENVLARTLAFDEINNRLNGRRETYVTVQMRGDNGPSMVARMRDQNAGKWRSGA